MKMMNTLTKSITILTVLGTILSGSANATIQSVPGSVAVVEAAPSETAMAVNGAGHEKLNSVKFGSIEHISSKLNDAYPKTTAVYFNTDDSFNPYDMPWEVACSDYDSYKALD